MLTSIFPAAYLWCFSLLGFFFLFFYFNFKTISMLHTTIIINTAFTFNKEFAKAV